MWTRWTPHNTSIPVKPCIDKSECQTPRGTYSPHYWADETKRGSDKSPGQLTIKTVGIKDLSLIVVMWMNYECLPVAQLRPPEARHGLLQVLSQVCDILHRPHPPCLRILPCGSERERRGVTVATTKGGRWLLPPKIKPARHADWHLDPGPAWMQNVRQIDGCIQAQAQCILIWHHNKLRGFS